MGRHAQIQTFHAYLWRNKVEENEGFWLAESPPPSLSLLFLKVLHQQTTFFGRERANM